MTISNYNVNCWKSVCQYKTENKSGWLGVWQYGERQWNFVQKYDKIVLGINRREVVELLDRLVNICDQ